MLTYSTVILKTISPGEMTFNMSCTNSRNVALNLTATAMAEGGRHKQKSVASELRTIRVFKVYCGGKCLTMVLVHY